MAMCRLFPCHDVFMSSLDLCGINAKHTLIARLMGPTWAPCWPHGPHVGPMNLAIWVVRPRTTCANKKSFTTGAGRSHSFSDCEHIEGRKTDREFADDIWKVFCRKVIAFVLAQISLRCIYDGMIENHSGLFEVLASCWISVKRHLRATSSPFY